MRWNDNRRQPMSGKHDKQKTRGAANTHNEKKDIIDPDTYFDGLCVCAGIVSVRALAILYAVPIHPCDCQMILRGYFKHRKKNVFTLGWFDLYIHRRPSLFFPREKVCQRLISRTFQFLPDEIYFLLFLLFFLSRTRPLSLVQPKRPKVCIVLYGWCV